MTLTTTLRKLSWHLSEGDGYQFLTGHFGPKFDRDTPIDLLTILSLLIIHPVLQGVEYVEGILYWRATIEDPVPALQEIAQAKGVLDVELHRLIEPLTPHWERCQDHAAIAQALMEYRRASAPAWAEYDFGLYQALVKILS